MKGPKIEENFVKIAKNPKNSPTFEIGVARAT
jgi:hypothetical protein